MDKCDGQVDVGVCLAPGARAPAVVSRQSTRSSHGISCGVKMKPGQLHVWDSKRENAFRKTFGTDPIDAVLRTITHSKRHKAG